MARLTYSLVVVEWHDAHTESGWSHVEEIDADPYPVLSVGHLIPDAKPDHVVLCQSVGVDGIVDALIFIPVGMIKRITTIHTPRTPAD